MHGEGQDARQSTPPANIIVSLGLESLWPRGTGKSSWLRTTFPNAHVIDLLDESLYQSLLADIGRFA